jgi:hypothetical protein
LPLQFGAQHFPAGLHWFAGPWQQVRLQHGRPPQSAELRHFFDC